MRIWKKVFVAVAVLAGVAAAAVLGHLALIEIGREVVVLRTQRPDGTWYESRLWIVDDGDTPWLHSGGPKWRPRFDGDPVVEVVRDGRTFRYRAHPAPGPHPRVHELMREKYGLADRWVRFLAADKEDTLAVRLEPLEP
jgi:hypothetical protein